MDMSINISLSFMVYWFSLCCAVFINFNVGFIYSRAYGHSIASIFMLSQIKNGQSSTFFPLWVHNKAVHLLMRPTASVYSDHHSAGGGGSGRPTPSRRFCRSVSGTEADVL